MCLVHIHPLGTTLLEQHPHFEDKWLGITEYQVYCVSPFRIAVPIWGQTTWNLSGLSPERDCSPERVECLWPHISTVNGRVMTLQPVVHERMRASYHLRANMRLLRRLTAPRKNRETPSENFGAKTRRVIHMHAATVVKRSPPPRKKVEFFIHQRS